MLPLAVSLRRLVGRSPPLAVRRAAFPTSRRIGPPIPSHASIAWSSSASPASTVFEDVEPDDAVALEPQQGFVDQKPIEAFALSSVTQSNLRRAGITHLFPVQTHSFDLMMQKKDIMGRSKTGSGKTLAFALPIIETILARPKTTTRHPQALVLLPTRELAQQVHDQVARVAPAVRTVNVVGGVAYTSQEAHLHRGVDLVVGTPGRILDLVDKGSLALDDVAVAVLDEADMMLKFGFQEAVETILSHVPDGSQTVMWSATFPTWVHAMARKFLHDPVHLDLVGKDDNHVPATVTHKAMHAPVRERLNVLANVLRVYGDKGQTLVFTETKQEADTIVNALATPNARALHGDLSQGMRTATLKGFRAGHVQTLVCTDIAARGLDIANVDLVVQYRLPRDKESFVHRAGRTGRAGRKGTNLVLFDRHDAPDVLDFERRYKCRFRHAAPPRPDELMADAVRDVKTRLAHVPPATAQLFEPVAHAMMDETGPHGLSAALALLCGFDPKHATPFSMLTGRHGMQTVEVDSNLSAQELHHVLVGFLDDRADIYPIEEGKVVVDVPYNKVHALQAHVGESLPDQPVKVALATELPRVVLGKSSNFLTNGKGRAGRFASRNLTHDRYGTSGPSRFGGGHKNWRRHDRDRGSRRDVDSSFGKGRPSSRTSYGRFLD